MSSRHVQILLQVSNLSTNSHEYHKTAPKRIPSHRIHEYHSNVLSAHHTDTRMTLQHLGGPIDAVSPEHSSDDKITNSKLIHKRVFAINFPKQNRPNPTKAGSTHYTTSARLFEYAQSQKLSSLTSIKIATISTPPFEGSFVNPWRRSNGCCYKVKTVSTPSSTPKKIRQDQTLSLPSNEHGYASRGFSLKRKTIQTRL